MKKTIVALFALAGMAMGAESTIIPAGCTLEEVWSIDFGSEYGTGTDAYELTGTLANKGTFWDMVEVEGGVQTSSAKRVHLAGGVYGSWDEDFQFSMSLTLGNADGVISASNNWPVFGEIGGSGAYVRFGPYTAMENKVALDGDLTKDNNNNLVAVEAGKTYTITLTKIGTNVVVAVDGVATGYGTLADSVTGNITDVVLGGDRNGNYKINQVVHNISWSKIVPEPATATLSLLALAGLAARRRRA